MCGLSVFLCGFFLMIRRPPRSTQSRSSAASDVYKRQDVEYALVTRTDGLSDERLILAKELVGKVFGDIPVKILKTYKGKALKGKRYAPLFTFLPTDKPAHYVVNAEYVTTSDGTGLVHIAPAFGADDMEVAKEYDLPVLMTINDEGKFNREVTNWSGLFVKDADALIIEELEPVSYTHLTLPTIYSV